MSGGRVTKRLRALALMLALLPAPAAAEPMQLDPANLLRLAVIMLDSQRPAEALAMAEALVQRDPGDAGALAVKSRAERDLGRSDQAVATARLAWKAAEDPGQKYDAAMVMAQGLASGGSKFRAQFWLRRAMEVAPDAAARRAAERDFRYVRTRSRLWLRFDASLRPSSNVNNGSSSSVLWFYGLPFVLSGDAMALSGTEGDLAISLRWRVQETESAKTDLRLGMVQSFVILSDEAKRQAPDARGSDYAYAAIEAGLDHAWKPFEGGEITIAGRAGHSWYGGAELSDYLGVDLGLSKALDKRLTLSAGLGYERQNRLDSARNSADVVTLRLGATRRFASGDRLVLGLTARDTQSDATEIDHVAARLRLDWDRARPVLAGTATLSLGLWAETRDYAQSRYAAGGREDVTLGAEVSLGFEKVDYMGFIPVMTLGAQRTDSNVSLYDSETLGLGLAIRSKF